MILNNVERRLAGRRTIQLFQEQYEKIEELRNDATKKGIKVPTTSELIRLGLDMVLEQLEKELGEV